MAITFAAQTAAAAALKLPENFEVPAADIERAANYYGEMLKAMPAYGDAKVQEYVAGVVARLAANAPTANIQYQVAVLDSEGVFAYSFADGHIVVSRGMLSHLNSEAELAAVLSHEIGHVSGMHQSRSWRQIDKAMDLEARLGSRFSSEQAREMVGALSLARVRSYGREQEVEADAWAELLLKKSGYDPAACARMLFFLVQYDAFVEATGFRMWSLPDGDVGGGVFATHPSSVARLELSLKRLHAKRMTAAPADMTYLNRLNGILFGISGRYGTYRDSTFVNVSRRVAFSLPKGWYAFGDKEEIIAASPDNEAIVRIQFETRTKDESLRDALRKMARFDKAKFETLTGAEAKGELAKIFGDDGTESAAYVAMEVGNQRLYCKGMARSAEAWGKNQETALTLIRSLRQPSKTEAAIEPMRISIERTATAGAVAPVPSFLPFPQESAEILNQLFPKVTVEAGQLVKVVR